MDKLKDIVAKLEANQNVFLTGGAGVGKTTLTKETIAHFEADGKKVARLASTGMAATLLGGQTLHSFLDLGIANNIADLELRKKLDIKKKIKKLIASMNLIVIDEISMVSAELFEMVRLRLLQAEFQGALLVVGDFLQLPPVVRGYGSVNFAFESSSWQRCDFETITLSTVYRTSDEEFITLLDAVRFARIAEQDELFLNSLVKMLPHDLSTVTFLFGKNNSALAHNKRLLAQLEGDLHLFDTQTVLHVKTTTAKEVERYLEDARVPKVLELKIGVPVLFTRNAWNYFNGERGRVVNIKEHIVHVEKDDGQIVKLERASMSKSRWEEKLVEGKKEMVEVPLITLYQYPIALAFAITIHKSQGMSLSDLVIESNEIFAPSQFYVAISRAISPHRLTLIAPNRSWQQLSFVNKKAVNFIRR